MTAAQETDSVSIESVPIGSIFTDEFGTVSVVEGARKGAEAAAFENVDGGRIDDGRYGKFEAALDGLIPKERRFTDPVRTFAYGTDASFYRLNPKLVVKVGLEGTRVWGLRKLKQNPEWCGRIWDVGGVNGGGWDLKGV